MCWRALATVLVISLISSLSAAYADTVPAEVNNLRGDRVEATRHSVEISISGRRLTLFQVDHDGERVQVAQYPVGTAVRGLDTYPLGLGKVTGIYFDPWWYPTPYSREVFRERGIVLPAKVPPGHPLNYMGPFKIALSHKTWKGAIYRIHGNNDPKRVGRRVTGGCFVMNNEDGLALARKIKVGTEVNIVP